MITPANLYYSGLAFVDYERLSVCVCVSIIRIDIHAHRYI